MDELSYTYYPNSNKLKAVQDESSAFSGFRDGANEEIEYTYDPNANMKTDKNKGITQIKYNHLNLPTAIYFSNNNKINYIYNAAGQKISKTVYHNNDITTTEYLDGFQYVDEDLQFFPTSEGYVRKTEDGGVVLTHQSTVSVILRNLI